MKLELGLGHLQIQQIEIPLPAHWSNFGSASSQTDIVHKMKFSFRNILKENIIEKKVKRYSKNVSKDKICVKSNIKIY